ncbi:hypothetical protein HY024_02900 [Candidatus Curtissbacteria bacterium]|nr:hypothetical protein [Candidatus Curtissbacteria bacterium]
MSLKDGLLQRLLDSMVFGSATLKDAGDLVGIFREQIPVSQPGTRAILETETLLLTHPILLKYGQFPGLHRLLRTAELSGDIDMAGASLLVGSGITLPEAAAVLVAPPPEEDFLAVLYMGPWLRQMALNVGSPLSPSRIPTRIGSHVIAIEPDEPVLVNSIAFSNPYFGFDAHQLTAIATTVGGALEAGLVPPRLNNIVWNRAEPSIFHGSDPEMSVSEKVARTQQVIGTLTERLVPGGSFVLTVGTGGNEQEREAREMLIVCAYEGLENLGLRVLPVYSTIYYGPTRENHKLLFGSTNFGAIGSVIAVKK